MDIVVDNPNDTVENNMIWLQNIQAECKLMAKLVEDLLFLARADSEQPVIYMENFELSNALKEALDPFQPAAGQHNLRLNKKLGRHVNFYGDQMRIKQLVSILIDNAIKYTPSGGDINLQLNDNPDNIEIIVSDTGEGIEPEHLTKIFERFYRVDKARARESGGTGLGLSIAELIVKEHHGTIKVRSKARSGTAFTVSFPKDRKISALLM
jgi:signal transduction histidine kinase